VNSRERLFLWLGFTVLPALIPLITLASKLYSRGQVVSIAGLFGKGELLLICSAFAAAGIGELIARGGRRYKVSKVIFGGCCLALLMGAIDEYGDVGIMLHRGECYNTVYIAGKGIFMCAASIAVSSMSMIVSGLK
jgi:hypothetical protein